MKKDVASIAIDRLRHVSGRVDDEFVLEMVELATTNLLEGKGSFDGSLATLISFASANAIHAYFSGKDIRSSKNWFWTVGIMQRARVAKIDATRWSSIYATYDSLSVACSDDEQLRCDMGIVIEGLHAQRKSAQINLISRQIGLILQRREAQAASELNVLMMQDNFSRIAGPFLPDFEVFKAMHFGSDDDLVGSLNSICDLNFKSARLKMEGGFTEGLLSTPANIYLRISWLIGRKVTLNDPLVPMGWMPQGLAGDLEFGFPRLRTLLLSDV